MTSAMRDVIQHGTGWRARSLGRQDIAGKTGTTNDQKDGWFAGFNSDLVTISWIGFDQPISLDEYGAQTAQPMWIAFMTKALAGKPEHSMPQPPGIAVMNIDPSTGNPTYAAKGGVPELFRTDNSSHYANENHVLPPHTPSANDWVNPDGGSNAKSPVNLPAMALGGKQDMDVEEEEKLENAAAGRHHLSTDDDDNDTAEAENTSSINVTSISDAPATVTAENANTQIQNTAAADTPAPTTPPENVAANSTANELARQALEDVGEEQPMSLY
jgi:membrane peptidoglycan carboxypeptidase